jgi:hypothetical protein
MTTPTTVDGPRHKPANDKPVRDMRTRSIRLTGDVYVTSEQPGSEIIISLPCIELDNDAIRTLDRLFPNTGTGIDRLLAIEALAKVIR